MTKIKCEICENTFEAKGKRKYCSKKCSDRAYYLNNKEKVKKRAREWQKNNPERYRKISRKSLKKYMKNNKDRFNKLMRKSYRNNKKKNHSRRAVKSVLKGESYKKYNPLKKECSLCGSKKDLLLYYEEYPTLKKEIVKALDNKKIYYLCKTCHIKKRKEDKKNEK